MFGIVHSADAGSGDDTTIVALALGTLLIAVFVTGQARAVRPLMPLRLFADRGRAGAYAARFLFNGVLVSFYFFMTQSSRVTAAACRSLAAESRRRRPAAPAQRAFLSRTGRVLFAAFGSGSRAVASMFFGDHPQAVRDAERALQEFCPGQ